MADLQRPCDAHQSSPAPSVGARWSHTYDDASWPPLLTSVCVANNTSQRAWETQLAPTARRHAPRHILAGVYE
eukprot:1087156-Pleurochrysis_carterae.AAC.2